MYAWLPMAVAYTFLSHSALRFLFSVFVLWIKSEVLSLTLPPSTAHLSQIHLADKMKAYTRMRSMSTDSTSKPTSSQQLVTPTPLPHRKEEDDDAKLHTRLSWQHQQEEQQQEDVLTFGMVLSRSCSSASQRFANGSSSSTLPTAVKRAFSMRRSSSVREGYWRIHDTADEIDEGELKEEKQHQLQVRYSRPKKQGKILRACKRIFGL